MMHQNLQRDLRSATFPVLVVEPESPSDGRFLLRYISVRSGMAPLVQGVLREVASALYNSDLTFEHLKVESRQRRGPGATTQSEETEVVWRLRVRARSSASAQVVQPTSR